MKRLAILAMVLALMFTGCAGFKNAFCSPTATQVEQAVAFAAQVAVMQPFFPPASVGGAAFLAILPNLLKIKDGYCVSDQANFLFYVQQLIASADQEAVALKLKDSKGQVYRGLKVMGLK